MMIRLRSVAVLLVSAIVLSFLAGYRVRGSRTRSPSPATGRQVLYYVDPMNPSFRSKEPGTAPCGMPLEPVYADDAQSGGGSTTASAGNVPVRADRQQLIGVTLDKAQRRAVRQELRLLGRVAVDETRLYRMFSVTEGWVREAGRATTGSIVAKGDILATFYTPEISTTQQTYLSTLATYERVKKTGVNPYDNLQGGTQLQAYEKNLRTLKQSLMNLGMTAEQIEEIEQGREVAPVMQIRAPASGFVLARNLSVGQRFEEGVELYTIADLSRIWVLADVFEGDAALIRAGTRCTVTEPGRGGAHTARVSEVLPQFDATTRTLKVRLEVANSAFALRPEMFVDVEMPIELGPVVVVPKEAILDSGTRRLVFVAKGDGIFEPRAVTTGWRQGDFVEIQSGLQEGESVVTSGNFLLDSESRMRAAGAAGANDAPQAMPAARQVSRIPAGSRREGSTPAAAAKVVDPICGMEVDAAKATAEGLVSTHAGRKYYFCSSSCKRTFDQDPAAPGKKQ
jgi:Cu(I)/Ag(I) efflux system membrane fusion protein